MFLPSHQHHPFSCPWRGPLGVFGSMVPPLYIGLESLSDVPLIYALRYCISSICPAEGPDTLILLSSVRHPEGIFYFQQFGEKFSQNHPFISFRKSTMAVSKWEKAANSCSVSQALLMWKWPWRCTNCLWRLNDSSKSKTWRGTPVRNEYVDFPSLITPQ